MTTLMVGADDRQYALVPTAVVTANTTAVANSCVLVDTTTAAVTVTLVAAPADKTVVAVKMVKQDGAGAHAVTIACGGSDVFNIAGGATTQSMPLINQAHVYQYVAASAVWVRIATDLPLSDLDARYVASATGLGGNPLAAVAKQTGSYAATANQLVPCDTTSGSLTVTLPNAPADRTMVAIKHVIQGGTNSVTFACAGSDVINKAGGSTTGTLSLVNQAVLLMYAAAGGIWYIVSDDLPLGDLDTRYLLASVLTTLGDVPYGGSGGALARLPGNTTTARQFLIQQGAGGGVSAPPLWGPIQVTDVPTLNQNSTGSSGSVSGSAYAVDIGGDAIALSGVSTTSGSHDVTCSTATWAATDVGKTYIDYTQSGGIFTTTTISAYISPTHIQTTAALTVTSTGHRAVYGTDATARINTLLAAGKSVQWSGSILTTNTLIPQSGCELRGTSMGAILYAAHSNNVIQSASWGLPYTAQDTCPGVSDMEIVVLATGSYLNTTMNSGGSQSYGTQLNVASSANFQAGQITVTISGTPTNCWTSGSNGGTKLGQVVCPTGALSIPSGSTVTQGSASTTTTGGTQTTAGAVSLPVASTSGWAAGSLTSPVFFWHNGNLFGYVSSTPFAACFYADPATSSAVSYITHGLVTPLNSQGHGVAFQAFRPKLDRVWVYYAIGNGLMVQGSGSQDPTVYGPHITRCRSDSAGWCGVEIGDWATDGYMDMTTINASGEAQLLVRSGDWSVGTVHLVCQAITPKAPALVVCANNFDAKEVIIDTCVGPSIVVDGSGRYKSASVQYMTLHSVRTVTQGSTLGQFGYGGLILCKERASTVVHSNLLVGGCNWQYSMGWLVSDGGNTKVANSNTTTTLSTTAQTLALMDVSGFDQVGGTFTLDGQTVTYTGVTYNTGQSSGSATLSVGTGSDNKTGTIPLSPALQTAPVDGDWYVVNGLILVQCNGGASSTSSLVYKQSMWLPWSGASGSTLKIFSNSFVSRQTLTGCTIASGTQAVALGDACQQASMALGTSSGSFGPGIMAGIGFGRSNLATGSSWTSADAAQYGMGVSVSSGTVSAGTPKPLASRGTATITNPATAGTFAHGLPVQSGQSAIANATATSNASVSGQPWVTADATNITVNVATTPTSSTTYNVAAFVPF